MSGRRKAKKGRAAGGGRLKSLFSSRDNGDDDQEQQVLLFGNQLTSPVKRALNRNEPVVKRRASPPPALPRKIPKLVHHDDTAATQFELVRADKKHLRESNINELLADLRRSSELVHRPPLTRLQSNSVARSDYSREGETLSSSAGNLGASLGGYGDEIDGGNDERSTASNDSASSLDDSMLEPMTLSDLAEAVHGALFGRVLGDRLSLFGGKRRYIRLRFAQTMGVDVPVMLAGRRLVDVLPADRAADADLVVRFVQQNPNKEGHYADLARAGHEVVWAVAHHTSLSLPESFLGHTLNGQFYGKQWLQKHGL